MSRQEDYTYPPGPEWWWPTSSGYGVAGVIITSTRVWPDWSSVSARVVVLETDEGTPIRVWLPQGKVDGIEHVKRGAEVYIICTTPPSRGNRNGGWYTVVPQREEERHPHYEHALVDLLRR